MLSILCCMLLLSGFWLTINTALAQEAAQTTQLDNKTSGDNKKLLNRIDFGNSYIVGQTIKSGAVYLLQRKKSDIKSMLTYRKDYRQEILEDFHIQENKANPLASAH